MDKIPVQAFRADEGAGIRRAFDLSREGLETKLIETILKGRWSKADLFLIKMDGERVVLKDFSKKSVLVRLIGRIQIWREEKAYRALGQIDGIPKFYGRPDRWSIVIEYVDGTRLTHYRGTVPIKRLIADLQKIIDAFHQAGVIHSDIRGRENIIVTREDGRLLLLDLAGAVILRPGSLLHRLFFNMLKKIDEAAYLKWKNILTPEDMSNAEKEFLKRFNFLRKFWLFNRKGS